MNILRSWKDSLSIFAPKNFKQFVLLTFKSIVDTYKIMFRYWWWLYVVLLGLTLFLPIPTIIEQLNSNFAVSQQQVLIRTVSYAWLTYIILFFTVLAVRPSVRQKNYFYFIRYIFIGFVIIILITAWSALYGFLVKTFITRPIFMSSAIESEISSKLRSVHQVLNYANFFFFLKPQYIYPILTFFTLFWIDLGGRVIQFFSAIAKTIKMTIYNYPLCLLFAGLFWSVSYVFGKVSRYIPSQYSDILWVFVLQIMICVWATVYIKRIHEQPDVYLDSRKKGV